MTRQITEVQDFNREEIEKLLMIVAKARIISGFYRGDFQGQTIEPHNDGYRVITTHTPASE